MVPEQLTPLSHLLLASSALSVELTLHNLLCGGDGGLQGYKEGMSDMNCRELMQMESHTARDDVIFFNVV